VFQAAYDVWRENRLSVSDQAELRTLLDWFEKHLATPDRFTASRYPRAQETAISWQRTSAHDHIARLRRLVALVEAAGIPVAELRTVRPGYIVYEDNHQVVALPFADTTR
jgi:phosphohistidine phosphatase SixA